jgi:signal transduction histidine kinase
MAIPIIFGGTGGGRFPLGVLNLESSRENAFSIVGQELAERFTRRIVNHIALIKIRADAESTLQDQFMTLAADQVLNSVHRINNCVGAIRAQANDLLYDLESNVLPEPDELAEALRKIVADAEEALAIPEELRKRIVTPQESDDVNAQVLAGIRSVKIPAYIELTTDLAPSLPKIPCTALNLVVENLMLNAVKAMHGRRGPLRVTTRLDKRLPREPFIVISVQDSGIGMTKDQHDRLFEPRQAGHQGGGLGFGMMWVRNWVRRAQGLINIESAPGMGTTAHIRFQVEQDQQVPQEGEHA